MKTKNRILNATVAGCLFLTALPARPQETSHADAQFTEKAGAVDKLRELTYVSAAYRVEVVHKLIEEANRVAHELQLPESLPITESNVTAEYIPPPRLAGMLNVLGNITTSNYTYYVSAGNKFSYLTKTDLDQDYPALRKQCIRIANPV